MEKKSSKTNKNEGNGELIAVNINGEEFLTLHLGRIIKTMQEFVKRVQTGNYSNDNPNLTVEEAVARFEKLPASQRRNFGVRPGDNLEMFIRVLNDVCGKEYLPTLGKDGIRCHFTLQDLITGKVDALTFIETFTNQVANHATQMMAKELSQVVPLFREENNQDMCGNLTRFFPTTRDLTKSIKTIL